MEIFQLQRNGIDYFRNFKIFQTMKKDIIYLTVIALTTLTVFKCFGQSVIIIYPDKDAVINSRYPNSNFGSSVTFESYLYNGKWAESRRSLIEFDFSPIPPGMVVTDAILTVYGINHEGYNESYLERIIGPWYEDSVTWNNVPMTNKFNRIVLPQSSYPDQDYQINVTSFVQEWLDGTYQNNGLMLSIGIVYLEETNALIFGSSDHPDIAKHPKLEITLAAPPLQLFYVTNDATCEGSNTGSIDITVIGGTSPYTFQWSNGETTEDIYNLYSGIYTVTVTDDTGNSLFKIFQINEPDPSIYPDDPEPCSELFISEYLEGSVHNAALEIYNPTDTAIWLNRYFLRVFMNGAPTPLITQLIGVLPPGETFVIAHPNADAAILDLADQTSNKLNFNGDDPLQLVKVLDGIPPNIDSLEGLGINPHYIFDTLHLDTIDVIGIPGVDPGNQGYQVGSGTTKDNTLKRSANVTRGTQDWDCGQMQWSVHGTDNISGLKQHQNICSACYSFSNIECAWYVKGVKETWSQQEDIYVFRLINKQAFTSQLDMSIVDSIVFYDVTGLKYNIIYFNQASTSSERQMIKEYIRSNVFFEFEFPAVTKSPNDDMTVKKWFISNDIIKIVFWDNSPTQTIIQYLKDKYDLFLEHEPNPLLPKGNNSWTYAFGINPTGCKTRNAINVASEIYEQEGNIIKITEPLIEPTMQATASIDDFLDGSWHIKNVSQCLGMEVSGTGTYGADCDIYEAWAMEYSGTGIKVMVIDNSIYDNNHLDISSKYINSYNFIDNNSDVFSLSSGSNTAHAQATAGIIAAIANNFGVTGVAYDAQIVPIISYYSESYKAFQYALYPNVNVDIINCSFRWYGYDETIENDIILCKTLGRGGKGIVIVCGAGNENCNNDDLSNCDPVHTAKAFPGYLPDVIGVIGSNPYDFRKSKNDNWNIPAFSWGSNYGSDFDVAAPSTHIATTDLAGSKGYNPARPRFTFNNCTGYNLHDDYCYFEGTSAATPVASGVCALILQANPNLTAIEVQDILQSTADKVGEDPFGTPYDYNAISPGRSLEMGYGRINAFNAVTIAGIANNHYNNDFFFNVHPNPANDYININFKFYNTEDVNIELFDYTGKNIAVLYEGRNIIPYKTYIVNYETKRLKCGVYFVILHTQSINKTIKLTVVR